jgi:hypothetical protein
VHARNLLNQKKRIPGLFQAKIVEIMSRAMSRLCATTPDIPQPKARVCFMKMHPITCTSLAKNPTNFLAQVEPLFPKKTFHMHLNLWYPRRLEMEYSPEEASCIFKQMDKDGNGFVSEQEFLGACQSSGVCAIDDSNDVSVSAQNALRVYKSCDMILEKFSLKTAAHKKTFFPTYVS